MGVVPRGSPATDTSAPMGLDVRSMVTPLAAGEALAAGATGGARRSTPLAPTSTVTSAAAAATPPMNIIIDFGVAKTPLGERRGAAEAPRPRTMAAGVPAPDPDSSATREA